MRVQITEAEAEALCDIRIARAVSVSREFLRSATADEQDEVSARIGDQVWADIAARFRIV
jgi:hypothetical protein